MILLRHGQSHFNVHYSATRTDPGIPDPGLTAEGVRQAEVAARELAALPIRRIIASPYTRTLHTAEIIARAIKGDVTVEPLVRERCAFVCDIGSPRSRLALEWPDFDFGDLPERWWPEPTETVDELERRCRRFRLRMSDTEDWRSVLVVTHWGFIRGFTGEEVPNCATVRCDLELG